MSVCYEQTIDRALALMEKHDHELEGMDVEALLKYAEFMAENPTRLWVEANPEQKRRFQDFLVPTGVSWDGEQVGTGVTGLFFNRLRPDSD